MFKNFIRAIATGVILASPYMTLAADFRFSGGFSTSLGGASGVSARGSVNGTTGFVYDYDNGLKSGPFGVDRSFEVKPDTIATTAPISSLPDEKFQLASGVERPYRKYAESATYTPYIMGTAQSQTRLESLDAGGGTYILDAADFTNKITFGSRLFFGIESSRHLFIGAEIGGSKRQYQQVKNHSFSTNDPNISDKMYNIQSDSTYFNVRADKYIALGYKPSSLDIYFGIGAGIEKVTLNGHLSGASTMKVLEGASEDNYLKSMVAVIPAGGNVVAPVAGTPGPPSTPNSFIMQREATGPALIQAEDPKINAGTGNTDIPVLGSMIRDKKIPHAFVSTSVGHQNGKGGGGPSMVVIRNHTFSRFNASARAGVSYSLNNYSSMFFGYMLTYTPTNDVTLAVKVSDKPRATNMVKPAQLANSASIKGLYKEVTHSFEVGFKLLY